MLYFILILIFLLIAYLFLILGLKIPKSKSKWLTKKIYTHRGLYTEDQSIPENSLKAFELAVENHYGIELDVAMTKDNVLVVFHDDNLKRLTGLDKDIWDCTYKEIESLTLANTSYTIPTFNEVLSLINGNTPLIIEIKDSKDNKKLCKLVSDELTNYEGEYCIESFNPLIVGWFKRNMPNIIRGQLSMNYSAEEPKSFNLGFVLQYMLLNFISRPNFIAYKIEDYNNISFKINRLFGIPTVAWTVNSKDLLKLANENYDTIIFENITP